MGMDSGSHAIGGGGEQAQTVIVMEYCDKGCLQVRLGRHGESTARGGGSDNVSQGKG